MPVVYRNGIFRLISQEQAQNYESFSYRVIIDQIIINFSVQNSNQNETQSNLSDYFDESSSRSCLVELNDGQSNINIRNVNNKEKINCEKFFVKRFKKLKGKEIIMHYNFYSSNQGFFVENKITNTVKKFNTLNEPIVNVNLVDENTAFAITNKNDIYQLNLNDFSIKKISDATSFSLNNEINLYFNNDKSNKEIFKKWVNNLGNEVIQTYVVKKFNLAKINPLNYKYISFIGDPKKLTSTRISWGNYPYYAKKNLYNEGKPYEIKLYLQNYEVTNNNINNYNPLIILDSRIEYWGLASIDFKQKVGLTFYWENGNYYLQVIIYQYCRPYWTDSGGGLFLDLGKGIKLHN